MKYCFLILLFGCTTTLNTVTLDGSASRVLNGDGTGYIKEVKWLQISGPQARIIGAAKIIATTEIKYPDTYSWELIGTDNLGNVGKDTFKITIK